MNEVTDSQASYTSSASEGRVELHKRQLAAAQTALLWTGLKANAGSVRTN